MIYTCYIMNVCSLAVESEWYTGNVLFVAHYKGKNVKCTILFMVKSNK